MKKRHKLWALMPALPKSSLAKAVGQYEAAGLEGVWSPQLYSAPFISLAAAAMASDTLKLGTGVALAFTRSPLETACSLMDLDLISEGRAVLGIGPSIKKWNEDWYGVEYGKPLAHLRETLSIISMFMEDGTSGDLGEIHGEYYHLDLRQFKTLAAPLRRAVPIYLPSVYEKSTQMAGELADGLLGHPIWTAQWVTENVEKNLKTGLDKTGRKRKDFDLNLWLFCTPNENKDEAIEDARQTIAWYGAMQQYERYYDSIGFGAEARALQDAAGRDDSQGMMAACTDEMVDAIALAGPPDEIRKRFELLGEIADSFTLCVPFYGLSPEKSLHYSEKIAETFY